MSEAKVIDIESFTLEDVIPENDPSSVKFGKRSDKAHSDHKGVRLSVFERQRAFENGWTKGGLDLVEGWLIKSNEGAENHSKAALVCRRKHRCIAVPSIVIGSVASALSFFSAGDECSSTSSGSSSALKYTSAIFTSAITIMGAVSELYSFNQLMTQHMVHSGLYMDLSQEIEKAIFIPNDMKRNFEVVLTDLSAKFSHIMQTAPLL